MPDKIKLRRNSRRNRILPNPHDTTPINLLFATSGPPESPIQCNIKLIKYVLKMDDNSNGDNKYEDGTYLDRNLCRLP